MIEPDPLSSIPADKKEKILQASIEVFGNKGYSNASTNEIIKKAEISKGLLFHYFGNKKNLYLTILDVVTDKFFKRFYSLLREDSNDIFEKLIIWNRTKFTLFSEFPNEYKILMGAFIDVPSELKDEIKSRYQQLSKLSITSFLKDIRYENFRPDIQPQKAIDLILMTMDSIGNRYLVLYKGKEEEIINDLPKISEELKEYLYMLKVGLYPETRD